jgi:hypothetical protein
MQFIAEVLTVLTQDLIKGEANGKVAAGSLLPIGNTKPALPLL